MDSHRHRVGGLQITTGSRGSKTGAPGWGPGDLLIWRAQIVQHQGKTQTEYGRIHMERERAPSWPTLMPHGEQDLPSPLQSDGPPFHATLL